MRAFTNLFFIILLIQYAFSANIDFLLEKAVYLTKENDLKKYFDIAFKSYNEGLYDITEKNCLRYLKNTSLMNENRWKILELLAFTYYRTKNKWAMKHYVEKELYKGREYIDKDTQKRIFVLVYNLFLDDKKERQTIKSKFRYIWRINNKKLSLPENLQSFTPFVNIFPYKNKRLFGSNKIYFSDTNQTLYEVGYKTDMGYDELREANPLIDPFDIRKDMALILPRKRLIPAIRVKVGEIYINLVEKRLYYVYKDINKSYIITFPIGVGTDDKKSPVGTFKISEKRKNPAWYVPENIRKENPQLPDVVPPGENNPLGTRAMRLGSSSYLIHGTNKSFGVGLKVSHGCIRLFNRDVERLFNLVNKGTTVKIYEKYIKASYINNKKYIEIHGRKKELKNINLNIYAKKVNKNYLQFIKIEKRGFAFPLF